MILDKLEQLNKGKKDWWYISFCDTEVKNEDGQHGFAGALMIQASSLEEAFYSGVPLGVKETWRAFGINVTQLGGPMPDPQYLNRVLNAEEVQKMYASEGGAKKVIVSVNRRTGDISGLRKLDDLEDEGDERE